MQARGEGGIHAHPGGHGVHPAVDIRARLDASAHNRLPSHAQKRTGRVGAIEPDAASLVTLHMARDISGLALIETQDLVAGTIEDVDPGGVPVAVHRHRAALAGHAHRALRTGVADDALRAGGTCGSPLTRGNGGTGEAPRTGPSPIRGAVAAGGVSFSRWIGLCVSAQMATAWRAMIRTALAVTRRHVRPSPGTAARTWLH